MYPQLFLAWMVCGAVGIERPEPVFYWPTASHPMSFDVSSDGRLVVVGERDGQVELFDLGSRQRVWINLDHQVNRKEKTLRSLEPSGWTTVEIRPPVTKVQFLPGETEIITGSWDTTIRCFRATDGRELWKLSNPIDTTDKYVDAYPGKPQVEDLAVAPNGAWIAVMGHDNSLYEWDIRDGKRSRLDQISLIKDHYYADVLKITPDGQYIVGSGSQNFLTYVWQADGLKEVAKTRLDGRKGSTALEVWQDGDQLMAIVGFRDGRIEQWQVKTTGLDSARESNKDRKVVSPRVSKDDIALQLGTTLPMPDFHQARNPAQFVKEFRGPSGRNAHAAKIKSVVVSSDHKTILSASYNFYLYGAMLGSGVMHVNNGAELKRERADAGLGCIRLWDLETGALLAEWGVTGSAVMEAQFMPDGKHILSAHKDGIMRKWALPSPELIAARIAHRVVPVSVSAPAVPPAPAIPPIADRPDPIPIIR